LPPLAVKVAFCPSQIVIVAGEMVGVGSGFTFTVLEAVAVQPLPSVTVTEYVVLEDGFTVIMVAVAPVLQE
jgi:ABC-type nitrate/sulfonate/bicarbonate transport system permease component